MITPKLRFSEFNSGWRNVTLGSLSMLVTSGSRDWAQHYSEMGSKFIRMTNLSRDQIDLLLDDVRYVDVSSNSSDGRRTSLISGDILMSITAELGKIGVIPDGFGEAYINQHTALIRLNEGVNPRFIAQLLGTKRQNKKINKLNDAGAKAGLNLPTIKSLEIAIPDSDEQKKIASFLAVIDQKISSLTKKHNLLIQYKKGVMQKIFDQEIRFKEKGGKDFPKWNICTLNERVLSIGSGGTPRSTTAAYYNGGIPWVSIADMTEQGKYISKTKKTLSSEGLKNSSAKLFPVGTVLYAMYASIGECSLADIGASTSQAILGIQTKPSELNNEFLYHWLCSIKDRVILMGQQGTQSNLNLEIVKNFEMNLPSLPEQMVIKSFLNVLDENIRIYGKRVELIKQYKQGLLQQMFV